VVVHFPSPPSTGVKDKSYAELKEIALESGHRLALLSEEYEVPIHIEGFGPSPFLSLEFIAEVISLFPVLRYCFDTGHMNLSAQRDGFDPYRFAEQVAPYVGSVHLWNNRGMDDYLDFHHIPVHPSQNPAQGWIDIARILETIAKGGRSLPLILESPPWYPWALGNNDYRDGVRWIKKLLETLS
jgi:sugar phosphate isomerase/epimerase